MEVLQRTANRGSIATGGYDIANSLKLEADNSEYMKRVMTATGNRKTFTISVWLKRTELQAGAADGFGHTFFLGGNGGTGTAVHLRFKTGTPNSDALLFKINTGTDNVTNRVFRDTSAWYHIVLAVDTTQATASNRLKLYVNGVQETSFATINYPTQNSDTQNNFFQSATYGQEIGAYESAGTYYGKFCGYLAEYNHIDGQALAPTEFGEFDEDTGIWKPKAYEGTYGTNGWYLDFVDAANLGDDSSGNSNNFTLTNITAADQATDTPTNNFCTLNPLVFQNVNGVYSFITEGATKARSTQFDVYYTYAPTFGVTRGKWYAEFEYEGSNVDNLVGILDIDAVVPYNSRLGKAGAWSVGLYQANGKLYITSDSGTTEQANWGASAADGDIISVAVDMDNYFVYFAKNGTWQNSGVPTSGATGTGGVAFDSNKTVGIGCSSYDQGGDDGQIFVNYGGFTAGTISSAETDENGYGTFEYAPPSGYYALCTKNLEEFG